MANDQKETVFELPWDFKKIVLTVIGIAFILLAGWSFLKFGVVGLVGAVVGIIIVVIVLSNPKAFAAVGTLLKGIFFAGLLIFLITTLGVYLEMPWLLVLAVEVGILFVLAKIEPYATAVTVFILVLFFPGVHYYATTYATPDSALAEVVTTAEIEVMSSVKTISPKKWFEGVTQYSKTQVAKATGDYYTAKVDAGAKKKLGVFISEIKTTQKPALFLQGEPIDFFSSVEADTLDFDVALDLTCAISDVVGEIEPKKVEFLKRESAVETTETLGTEELDCIFSKEQTEKLKIGSHSVKITGVFNFASVAYAPVYFMDKEKVKALKRRNLLEKWKELLPPNALSAITTTGPVRIGMGVGSQPSEIERGERGPTIGVTIENAGAGHVKSLGDVFVLVPKGLVITDVNGKEDAVHKGSCSALREDQQKGCDDDVVDVYNIEYKFVTPQDVKAPHDFLTLRMHTKVETYDSLVGAGTTPPAKRIFAMVNYVYEISQEKNFVMRAAEVSTQPEPLPEPGEVNP